MNQSKYKYAAMKPSLDKNQKIRNPGIVIMEIADINFYPDGKTISNIKTQKEHDLTKKKSLVFKERAFRGRIDTPSSKAEITYMGNWGGTIEAVVFETFTEAVEYKIKATQFCIKKADDNIAEIKAKWDKQSAAISKSMENVHSDHPEMFL